MQSVTSSGAGGNLRIQRPGDGNDTVSEGIAYGMLLAAYTNDRATFDGLWRYAKSQIGQWHNAAFVAPAASGALLSGDQAYRSAMWKELLAAPGNNYYMIY